MVDLNPLISQLNAIDSMLAKTNNSAESVQKALGDLAKLKYTTSDPEGLKDIERRIQALKELQKQSKDTYEGERKSLEAVVGQNKQLLELLDKTILKHEALRKVVLTTAGAFQTLREKGDLGQAIAQMSAFLGPLQSVGVVFGTVISVATKFQDRIQSINKTVIDATASVGRFREGMAATERQTLALSTGIARYAAFTGVATEEVQKQVGALSALGFSMDEMGIDKTTGEITTLTDAIRGQAGEFGALSTALGVSRATGLDVQSVMQTMGMQVKTLGDTVEEVAGSFAALSFAADKSGLSTQTLLPLVRSMQEQFKFLGFDSASAAEMLGKAGEVAEAAGLSAGQATDVMAKAISGIAGMDFGQMAFFGQQMGMGGGLTAGFRFRERAGGEGGGNLAAEIGRSIGNLMGGGGQLITEEQARSNEQLAGIRLAQEQFAAQSLGLSQNEARVFINMAGELENLRAAGEGQSERAKDLEKQLKGMEMGEGEYRRKTLTMQQKIAQLLELVSALVGRLVLTFIRAFMGGAAEDAEGGVTGLFKTAMESISKGEGFDVTFGPEGLQGQMNEAFKEVDPVVEKWGKRLGGMFDTFFGSWPAAIGSALGGVAILAAVRRGTTGLFSRAFGGLLGGGVRAAAGAAPSAAGTLLRAVNVRGGAAVGNLGGRMIRGVGGRIPGIGALNRGLSSVAGKFPRLAGGLTKFGGALKGVTLGSAGLGTALVAVAAAGIATKVAMDHYTESVNRRVKGEEEATGAANKHLTQLKNHTAQLEEVTKVSNFEAKAIMDKVIAGEELTEKQKQQYAGREKFIAKQALSETQRQKTLAVQAQGAEGKGGAAGGQEYIQGLHSNTQALEKLIAAQNEKEQKALNVAAGEKLPKFDDALSISKAGLLYASPGDVVVSEDSMGEAVGGGKGEAVKGKGGGGEAEAITQDVILNVKFMHDIIGEIATQQVKIAVEKDIVAPGKAGKAGLRHGQNKGYG